MSDDRKRFEKRKNRIRNNIAKVSDRFRLSVFKSGRHIYAQVIDDNKSITLVSASSLDKSLRLVNKCNNNVTFAAEVGKLIGIRAKESGISNVVFDKGGYQYHGAIKALADAARENLSF